VRFRGKKTLLVATALRLRVSGLRLELARRKAQKPLESRREEQTRARFVLVASGGHSNKLTRLNFRHFFQRPKPGATQFLRTTSRQDIAALSMRWLHAPAIALSPRWPHVRLRSLRLSSTLAMLASSTTSQRLLKSEIPSQPSRS
jgi:hypothetical protein